MNERVTALASALASNGVAALFGVPGSGLSWQLITALEEAGVPFRGATHEAAGAIMAGAFGRQTGRPAASISIKGPGLANMLPGIVSNHYEQWPVLSVAEAFGPATPSARKHKRLDHESVLAPVVNGYATLGDPGAVVPELLRMAGAGVPGPVHLDLFAEEGARIVDYGARRRAQLAAAGVALADLEKRIRAAERPIVIAGSLAARSAWGSRLSALRVPVFTTVAAKGVLDESGAWSAGIFTGDGKALTAEHRLLPQADLVIGIGLRNLEVLSPKPFAAPLLLLDVAGGDTGEGFGAALTLTTDDAGPFETALDALAGAEWGAEEIEQARARLDAYLTEPEWLPGQAFAEAQRLISGGATLVLDTGSFCTVGEHVWRAATPRDFLCSANGRYMGTSLPMAMGSAFADRSRATICAFGDGGARMYTAEIKLAVEERLPILFLLMTDGRYGSIACAPSAPSLSPRAVAIPRPSWFAAIAALGCPSERVESAARLESSLAAWSPESGPLFLELGFDPDRYARMTEGVR